MSKKRSKSKGISRREFLRLAALTTGSVALAGYAQQFNSLTPDKAAAATAVPTATGAAGADVLPGTTSELGGLVGTLEGPEIILDPDLIPKTFSEAPMLAEMVSAGTLPEVAERLPFVPMVIKPLQSIGTYGGTWRRGFTGPGDNENGNRIVSTDKILFWDYTGTQIRPSLAKDWEISDDGTVITIYLREGMKWSDGEPFTTADFMFWYEDMYQNTDIVPTPTPELSINGKPGIIEAVDDYTLTFTFEEPYYLFIDVLAGSTLIGGGQATRQARGFGMGAYAPAHYLKQFLPKNSSEDELNAMATEEGFDGWISLIKFKMDWTLNPDLPTLTPWKTTVPINQPTWVLERNPYYWAVDTEGNQLPYIDKIVMTLAENLEVLNLRAVAGEFDEQERHTALTNLPVFLENQEKSGYTVHLDPAFNGADSTLHVNQSYDADPEIAKWLQNKDFRHALSLGIDRDQLNETFWLGTGTPGSIAPSEALPYNPGPEYRTLWCTYDPDQANALLDEIGLDQKDSEGYRLRTDNGERLLLELITVSGAFVPFTQHAEMIREQWKEIGIEAVVKELERTLAFTRSQGNENQIMFWANDGSEIIYLFPRHALPVDPVECHMGPLIARWYATNGAEGTAPPSEEMKKALDMFRGAAGQPAEERITTAQEIWKILCEEQWSIGTVGQSPAFMGLRIVNNALGNIPSRQVNAQHARTPCSSHPTTFYFKEV